MGSCCSNLIEAAKCGHLDCLQAKHERGDRWERSVTWAAVSYDHLHCLKYAIENGCPSYTDMAWLAAIRSALCLRYLCERGFDMNYYEITFQAGKHGNIEVLKYAYKMGSPWDVATMSIAAVFGNYECMVFAHENNAPYLAPNSQWTIRDDSCADYYKYHNCHTTICDACSWDRGRQRLVLLLKMKQA